MEFRPPGKNKIKNNNNKISLHYIYDNIWKCDGSSQRKLTSNSHLESPLLALVVSETKDTKYIYL
jgi:hypothetical protein